MARSIDHPVLSTLSSCWLQRAHPNVRVRYDIDADAPRAELEGIVAQSQKRSAVFDILTNPTSVSVDLV
jgi:hypothetical protein